MKSFIFVCLASLSLPVFAQQPMVEETFDEIHIITLQSPKEDEYDSYPHPMICFVRDGRMLAAREYKLYEDDYNECNCEYEDGDFVMPHNWNWSAEGEYFVLSWENDPVWWSSRIAQRRIKYKKLVLSFLERSDESLELLDNINRLGTDLQIPDDEE